MSDSLLLTKDELAEVLKVLWAAKEEGAGDKGDFLSGPLIPALTKLNGQFEIRFGGVAIPPSITLAELEVEFSACDEIFAEDVSEIHIEAALDVHFRSAEVEVSIFGAGGPEAEEFPMVHRIVEGYLIAPEELIEAGLPVPVTRVLSLFDKACLKVLADRGVPVVWNPGWESETTINLCNPDHELILRLEPR